MCEFARSRTVRQFYLNVFTQFIDLPEADIMPANITPDIFSFKSTKKREKFIVGEKRRMRFSLLNSIPDSQGLTKPAMWAKFNGIITEVGYE